MKSTLFVLFMALSYASFGQLTITGTGTANSVPNNGPAVVVDGALTITTALSIPAFRVKISANFSSGDVLAYTGSLPSGVTASYSAGTGILTFTGSSSKTNYQALLRTVTFNTTSSSTSARTITFEAGDGSLSYNSTNGHFYAYTSGTFSWTAAKADAISKSFFGLQGYLATITTSSENTFVNALTGKGWIGASDEFSQINAATGVTTYSNQTNSEGHWYWVTGPEKGTNFSTSSTAITYANWMSGEPSNSSSLEHYAENSYGSGQWNDTQNGGPFGYVLEYGGTSGDPTVNIWFSRDITMIATKLQTVTSGASYQLHDVAMFVDQSINVYSVGSITDAKVTISGNFNSGDVLSYTGALPSGITVSGSGYNSATGVLSFSGTTTAANWQALFRTVKFNSTSNVKANRDITFSVGNLVAFSNGHFYESVSPGATWTAAKTAAAARTYNGLVGYLATITSTAENDFIKQKLGTDAWIGLSDAFAEINAATGATTYAAQTNSEGKFYWVTGPEKGTQVTTGDAASTSVTGAAAAGAFNNWNTGEPNNSGVENYGEIYAATAPGKWNDLNGTQSLQYVVEYGGLSSDPLVTLTANSTIISNTVLPVTGLSFTAKARGNDAVALSWSTVSEFNCDRFDILRSHDGVHFEKIGTVAGHGNTNDAQNYSSIDKAPVTGPNYYRLYQFDFDGQFTYSPIRQVTYAGVPASLAPNPATAEVVITQHTASKNASLTIYNLAGNIVLKTKLTGMKTTINVHSYSPGVYVATIADSGMSQKIVFIKR